MLRMVCYGIDLISEEKVTYYDVGECKQIECSGGNTIKVTEEISYPGREAQYVLYVGEKETADYLLRHKIEGETGPYQNTVTVYDGEGVLLQTFEWESFMDENYLEFADLNQDGYVVEVYRWDGNKLIMESQEYIEPDE